MGLSVIVFMQKASSGDRLRLHGAANQFMWLHQQITWDVLGEVQEARKTADWMSSGLH
jgi:hypothetical protein